MKINQVGSVGEIYTDPESGKMYKCTYAYKDSNGNIDCEWKVIIGEVTVEKTEIESEKIPERGEEIVSETNVTEGDFQKKSETQSQKIPEGKNPENIPNHKPNKTRYTNYSKK